MKFFKHNKSIKGGSVLKNFRQLMGRIGRDPRVDWVVIVLTSFLTMVILATSSWFKYNNYDSSLKNQVAVVKKASDSSTIDTKTLDAVIKMFKDRAAMMDALNQGYTGPSDPAL